MTVRGKITSTKSGIPANAAVRFRACTSGWTTFYQTNCFDLGSRYIDTCTAMYGREALSESLCADVGTYDFYTSFRIPNYGDKVLHMGTLFQEVAVVSRLFCSKVIYTGGFGAYSMVVAHCL